MHLQTIIEQGWEGWVACFGPGFKALRAPFDCNNGNFLIQTAVVCSLMNKKIRNLTKKLGRIDVFAVISFKYLRPFF